MPSTQNNPYGQGGWSNEAPYPAGMASPTPSDRTLVSSDGTLVSTGVAGQVPQPPWIPPQSSFGALPFPQSAGSVPSSTTENYIPFRFSARGSNNFLVLGPNDRALYRVISTGRSTIMSDSTGRQIARIDWQITPSISIHGLQTSAAQWLRLTGGRRDVYEMKIRGVDYLWTTNSRGYNLAGSSGSPRIASVINTAAGQEIRILGVMAGTPQTVESIIVATIVLQGPRAVGL